MPPQPRRQAARRTPAPAGVLHPAFVTPRLAKGIPLKIMESLPSHAEVGDWMVDNGLIRSVRKGEDTASCIRRALTERIGTRMDAMESKLGKFTLQLVPSAALSSSTYSEEMEDTAILELHRDADMAHIAIIGPTLERMEAARKGEGKAVATLLRHVERHGCGAFTAWDARDEAERRYWGGEPDETMQLAESREGDNTLIGKSDAEACEMLGLIRAADFQTQRADWLLNDLPTDPGCYPPGLRALATQGLALLAEAHRLAIHKADRYGGHYRPHINEALYFDARSWSSANPIVLQWTAHDPTTRILDDANQSDFECGDMLMGYTAAFCFPPFPTVDAAAFDNAMTRLGLWIQLTDCTLALIDRLHTVTALGLEAH